MCGRGSGFCLLGVGPFLLYSEGVSRLLVKVNLGLLPASSASGSSSPSFRFQHPLLPRLLVTLYLHHSLNEQNSSPLPGCQPAHPSCKLGTPPLQEESVVSHQEGGWEPEMRVPAPPADASPQVCPTRTPGVPLRAPFHTQLPDCPLETQALSVFSTRANVMVQTQSLSSYTQLRNKQCQRADRERGRFPRPATPSLPGHLLRPL